MCLKTLLQCTHTHTHTAGHSLNLHEKLKILKNYLEKNKTSPLLKKPRKRLSHGKVTHLWEFYLGTLKDNKEV